MKHPDELNQPKHIASANRFSAEPQAEPSTSTSQPGLTPGIDFQPGNRQGNAVLDEAPHVDALMRRYNR
jgi:hypothetical protein